MAHVLITGGTGFIGAHLVRDCLARGSAVTVVTRPGSNPWRLADVLGRITLVPLAAHDAAGLAALVDRVRPQHVFHLAATTRFAAEPGMDQTANAMACNVAPLQQLLDVLSRTAHVPDSLVRTGTLAEFGEAAEVWDPDAEGRPATAYGKAALAGTQLLRDARAGLRFPAVTARLSLTYGGDQSDDFLVADCIHRAISGKAPPLLGRPDAERDLLHVSDVVAALQLVARHAATLPASVVVATGRPVRMTDLCRDIPSLVDGKPVARCDMPRMRLASGCRLSCRPSPELLALGWSPRTSLTDGLKQVIAWERRTMLPTAEERRA